MSPREEMVVMARALAIAMGREFIEREYDAPVGAWFIERADTDKPLYRLAERRPHGALSHPLSSAALSSQGLADALYFARHALNVDRDETRQIAEAIGAMRRADTEFIGTDTVHERVSLTRATVERVVRLLTPCWCRA